jgi:hypothetical protein
MSRSHPALDQTSPPENPAQAGRPSRSTILLTVIGKLIAFGHERFRAIRSTGTPRQKHDVAVEFGTIDTALILRHILRGLRLAIALHGRVTTLARRLDNPPPRPATIATGQSGKTPRTRRPALSDEADSARLRAHFPTPAEIAAMMRDRSTGRVLLDICRDLGINITHPLWQEVNRCIDVPATGIVTVWHRTQRRLAKIWQAVEQGLLPNPFRYNAAAPAATGPPRRLSA